MPSTYRRPSNLLKKIEGQSEIIYRPVKAIVWGVGEIILNSRFKYKGVLISNADMYIDSYKPSYLPMAYGANNHGSIICINESWYIFYHRHTNGTWYSRQGCAEKLRIDKNGEFIQAEMTSCGLNGVPLEGKGEYPAYLACNLFTQKHCLYVGEEGSPRIMQDGKDGDKETGYIGNILNGSTAGFKYFDCQNVRYFSISVRGYAQGKYEIRTDWNGDVYGEIEIEFSNIWETYSTPLCLPDGINAIYLTFRGSGNSMLKSFTLG